VLHRFAAALAIPLQVFGLTPPDGLGAGRHAAAPKDSRTSVLRPRVSRERQWEDGEDPMRRRELLAGLTGLTGALLLPPARPPAGSTGPDAVSTRLEQLLTGAGTPAAPVPSRVLETGLAAAWRAFDTCRYQALAERLPRLVSAASASRDQAAGRSRQACSSALADAYVLASELALKVNEDGIAWVAADRALPAARDSEDPATIAAASRAVAMAMRRLGHYDGATSMLTSTALGLDADRGDPPAPVLAAYGSLLCTAAYACAQNGQRPQALDLIGEAGAAAARMSDARTGHSVFGTANVAVYQIGIHTALGDPASALDHARAVNQAALPTPERHARFCIDTARAWEQHGRPDQACHALLAAERHSPEETRRPSVVALISAMIQAPGPRAPGLGQLAERSGALT
jgi:hypothetical protein